MVHHKRSDPFSFGNCFLTNASLCLNLELYTIIKRHSSLKKPFFFGG